MKPKAVIFQKAPIELRWHRNSTHKSHPFRAVAIVLRAGRRRQPDGFRVLATLQPVCFGSIRRTLKLLRTVAPKLLSYAGHGSSGFSCPSFAVSTPVDTISSVRTPSATVQTTAESGLLPFAAILTNGGSAARLPLKAADRTSASDLKRMFSANQTDVRSKQVCGKASFAALHRCSHFTQGNRIVDVAF